MGVVTDKDIISELISIVGPQSIVSLISEQTFKENDNDNFISLQLGKSFADKVKDLESQDEQNDVIKSARSDKSSQRGEDLKGERIYHMLKKSLTTDQNDSDNADESDLMYNQDFNDDADVDEEEDMGYFNDEDCKYTFGHGKKLTGSSQRKIEKVQKNLDKIHIDDN